MLRSVLLAALASASFTAPALAASPAAWDEFRLSITRECLALASERMIEPEIRVDPFGSQTYGLAVVSGSEDGERVERVCVMDKASKVVELGNPIPPLAEGAPETMTSAPDAAQSGCDAACQQTEGLMAQEDLHSIRDLSARVAATLEDLDARDEAHDSETDRIADLVSSGAPDLDYTVVVPGSYRCTVYWYGFLDQGARRVGTHRCEIEENEGGMEVRKVSGERLTAGLFPWADGVRAYMGRTFLEDHAQTTYDRDAPTNGENDNFGNKVGVALADGGTLYLVSGQSRGMAPPDPTFFEVIELVPAQ
ncbi:hypothetical protein [Pararhizobium haloflavum]|uniref:hypothetical protein n=1 Tax=Pararhizobium haloflavum TaxID=2037914 RepID=UPI0012FFFCB3|nr:hypothetical protein [Pararhizobium haloflavum]